VAKFAQRKAREMQAQRQSASRNEDAANFSKRPLNIHVRQSDSRNHTIETVILEWQLFARAIQINAVWKSHAGDGQATLVDVKPCNLIGRRDPPRSQILSGTAT